MSQLVVNVLGPFEATLGGERLTFRYEKLRALLAFLAVEAGRPHPREALVALLWPDVPDADARRNLSQALFHLRQLLGDSANPPQPYLLVTREAIEFNPSAEYDLDVARFLGLLKACEQHAHPSLAACAECAERLEVAAALYRGDALQHISIPMAEGFEEWLLFTREDLHRRMLSVLDALIAYYDSQQHYESALRGVRQQLALEPWREEAHVSAMRFLALSGQRSAALAQYAACQRVLANELGVEPAAATRALYEQIKAGTFPDRTAPVGAGPAAVPGAAPGRLRLPRLPAPLTPFVGREQELAELGALLLDPNCRLLTLAGPGGIGKTRLALQAAAQHSAAFADGAAFVSLAPLAMGDLFNAALAEAVGLALTGTGEPRAQILAHLADRQLLIVLDNFEHLAGQPLALEAVSQLLLASPALKLLVTSRERLELAAEWVYEVEGLGEDALTLFAQSARRAKAGYELAPDDEGAVRRIGRLVDGSPLALELAAAWVHVLSVAEVASEIERGLDFLSAPARLAAERHRSMQAVFDHSWQRLAEAERRALCRLAVFRSGFSREAAGQVAGATLSLMSVLVSKSLLRRGQPGRYTLHELVRQFALAKLAEDPAAEAETRQQHGEYFAGFLAQRHDRLIGSEQRAALAEMAQDADNVQAAWTWFVEHGPDNRLSQMAPGLAWLYELQHAYRQGIAVFEAAARALEARAGNAAAALALNECRLRAAFFYFRVGQRARARAQFEACTAAFQALNQPERLVDCLVFLGFVDWQMGLYAEAAERATEGLALARSAGSLWHQNLACSTLGLAARARGEYAEAHRWLTEAANIAKAGGLQRAAALTLAYLSAVHVEQNRPGPGEALARESLALARQLDEPWCVGVSLTHLAYAVQARGDASQARDLAAEAVAIFTRIDDTWRLAQALVRLGAAQAALSATDEAVAAFEQAFALAPQSETPPVALEAAVGLAALHAQAGAAEAAYGWLLAAQRHPAITHAARAAAKGLAATLTDQLTPEQIAQAERWALNLALDKL